MVSVSFLCAFVTCMQFPYVCHVGISFSTVPFVFGAWRDPNGSYQRDNQLAFVLHNVVLPQPQVREQITRVLLERLIVHRLGAWKLGLGCPFGVCIFSG